ncbi:MAG: tRNA glutamyl-Q(34) synthetase GluQRS, partial [Chrysiogenetes bacterium]|nr:tRNA glutamyl-Q(34) synthetase GluQRS [Chrysiogenetes bacterium]
TSGEKFSKRERDVCVGSLQQAGCSATEIVGFLAHSAGLIERPEPATPADLLPGFSLEGLKAADTRVDPLSLLR